MVLPKWWDYRWVFLHFSYYLQAMSGLFILSIYYFYVRKRKYVYLVRTTTTAINISMNTCAIETHTHESKHKVLCTFTYLAAITWRWQSPCRSLPPGKLNKLSKFFPKVYKKPSHREFFSNTLCDDVLGRQGGRWHWLRPGQGAFPGLQDLGGPAVVLLWPPSPPQAQKSKEPSSSSCRSCSKHPGTRTGPCTCFLHSLLPEMWPPEGHWAGSVHFPSPKGDQRVLISGGMGDWGVHTCVCKNPRSGAWVEQRVQREWGIDQKLVFHIPVGALKNSDNAKLEASLPGHYEGIFVKEAG